MPHLRLEFSANLPADVASRKLLSGIHQALADHGVSIGNCKSRVESHDAYLIGDGSKEESFVHLEVGILEGRSDEVKRSLGQALLERLEAAYQGAMPPPQITIELRDMRRADYFKHPPGTI